MAAETKIEWTSTIHPDGTKTPGATANFWWGCVKVSALCDHCYAETLDKRYGGSNWELDGRRRFIKSVWNDLPKWNDLAQRTGQRKRVFVMSMGDFFEDLPKGHPDREEMQAARIKAIHLMDTTWTSLDFLVLTKRISNVAKMVPARWTQGLWPRNVRLGISVGTQKDAGRDIPRLLEIDCPNFLSMEPLLERVDLTRIPMTFPYHAPALTNVLSVGPFGAGRYIRRIDWVITGGESGPHARPSHPDWFRFLRDQCAAADVPFHFKQGGAVLAKEWACSDKKGGITEELPVDLRIRQFPGDALYDFAGRSNA